MLRRLLVILALCPLTSFAQTSYTDNIQHGGLTREFKVYVPAAYNAANPTPLVFNLHGYTSNMTDQEFYADFRPIADTANFILIHPNGTIDGSGNRHWNVFGGSTVDDVDFIDNLIDSLDAQYNIDPERIYSTGMSNGGFMSYKLACELSNRITSVASVTGSMMYADMSTCSPSHPTPIMQIHGTADGTVPYAGTATMAAIDSLVRYWGWFNNCTMTATMTPVPNTNTTDGATAEHYVFPNGDNGTTSELFKVINGAHTWPGAPVTIGTTCQDFDASVEIWKFFSRYSLTSVMSTDEQSAVGNRQWLAYPNPSNGQVTLKFERPENRSIIVHDIAGKEVMQIRTTSTEEIITIDTPGIYVVTVQGTEFVSSERVVIR